MEIYQLIIYGSFLVLIGFTLYSLFYKKGLTAFLHKSFSLAFWISIVYLIFSISIQLFTETGEIKLSDKNNLNSSHYSNGYNVPVKIHLTFKQKKVYKSKRKDSVFGKTSSITITRIVDEKMNRYNSNFYKNSEFTEKEIDSIFKFSKEIKTIGKKLKIDNWQKNNSYFTTNTSSITTNGFINIKSSYWLFTLCQIVGTYLTYIILILIFYQLKNLFKTLNNHITFSNELTKQINLIGVLIIVWQLIKILISVIYSFYYSYVGFENKDDNLGIQLNINPRLDFDLSLIFIGLGLLVLSILLKKGNAIQQENDLTI